MLENKTNKPLDKLVLIKLILTFKMVKKSNNYLKFLYKISLKSKIYDGVFLNFALVFLFD